MKCPQCHSDNGSDSKFCKECGTNMTSAKEVQYEALSERYEILDKIGEGGMGAVYCALDRNLDRRVAIKVLPEEYADNPERLARFEREAKLLAALNHPNIAAIYGLEESRGRKFLVLEWVEGEILRDKLQRGALDLDETIVINRQIAEGLEAAHEKGIVHRDLKPANIILSADARVKILDFGLAKAFAADTTGFDVTKTPTITEQMTKPGMVWGTAAYMSPEQARGQSADRRTDIWTFGCILYECLTGTRVFTGETSSDIMARVLKADPDWSKLPSHTPPMVKRLLQKCLQKDPKQRLHSIADARIELVESIETDVAKKNTGRRFSWGWILAGAAALFVLGFFLASLVTRFTHQEPSSSLIQSSLKLDSDYRLAKGNTGDLTWPNRPAVVFSKDGSFLVYSAVTGDAEFDDNSQLFIRHLDESAAKPILGTESAHGPFLSPDNSWVGFFAGQMLRKVSLSGGVPHDITGFRHAFGASWGEDGHIIYGDFWSSGLYMVSDQGGTPEILTVPDPEREEFSHRLPFHLPHGQGLLFTIVRFGHDQEPRIAILDLNTVEWRVLLENASDARYISTGHLVFMRNATLMAIPFDLKTLDIYGRAIPIIPNVMHITNTGNSANNLGIGQFSISENGSIVYVSGGIIPKWKNLLIWVDRNGDERPVSSRFQEYLTPMLSPDGSRVVYIDNSEMWIHEIDRDITTPIVTEGTSSCPIWMPDGEKIIFTWQGATPPQNIYMMSLDGRLDKERLTISQTSQWPVAISPDGNLLAFVEHGIFLYDFRNKKITPFAVSGNSEWYPEFSPDGQWITYSASSEGRFEVYVQPTFGSGEINKVSYEGGKSPLWTRSGNQIIYMSIDNQQMWVVDVRLEPALSIGKPRLLFDKDRMGMATIKRNYDISLDDRYLLMVKEENRIPQPVTEMILIQNWFDEVNRLVPTERHK
jgi:serine/threonine protein kinase